MAYDTITEEIPLAGWDEVPDTDAVEARANVIDRPQPAPLEARDVSAWFGDLHVLDRVSLLMEAGEVTALIGPSGCGKSTFLRILNRMHEMTPSAAMAGEVLLDGEDIYDPKRAVYRGPPQHRHGLPEAQPVPGDVDLRQRARGPQAHRQPRGPGHEGRARRRLPRQGRACGRRCATGFANRAARSPVVSSSGCASRGRWRSGPGCCSWTSRARPSTPPRPAGSSTTIEELRSEVTIVIVTHNMQQAAARLRLLRVLPRRAGHARATSSSTARPTRCSRPRRTPAPSTTSTGGSAERTPAGHFAPFFSSALDTPFPILIMSTDSVDYCGGTRCDTRGKGRR